MAIKDQDKPYQTSVHEQSAILREQIASKIVNKQPANIIVPKNVFAMTFATNENLLEQMRQGDISIIFRLENNQVIINLVKSAKDNQVSFTKALTDPYYRDSLLERWYKSLYFAFQNPDINKATEIADNTLSQSAVPLGLVAGDEGQSISIFDLDKPDLCQSYHIASMRQLAEFGTLNERDRIFDYLSNLWIIIGEVNRDKQQSMNDISPAILANTLPGSAIHSGW